MTDRTDAPGWSLEDRAAIMIGNWIKRPIPKGLVEDVIAFAALFGDAAKRNLEDKDLK